MGEAIMSVSSITSIARPRRPTGGRRSTASRPGRPPRRRTRRSGSCCAAACPPWRAARPARAGTTVPEPSSLMPGPAGHGVQVRAEQHDVVRVAALGLRDHVRIERLDVDAVGGEVDGRVLAGLVGVVELLADGEAREHGRDRVARISRTEQRVAAARGVALVEEDHADRARRRRRSASFCANAHVPRWISDDRAARRRREVRHLAAAGGAARARDHDVVGRRRP